MEPEGTMESKKEVNVGPHGGPGGTGVDVGPHGGPGGDDVELEVTEVEVVEED
jgi:hypothetical protein